jgi:hypothetical protein
LYCNNSKSQASSSSMASPMKFHLYIGTIWSKPNGSMGWVFKFTPHAGTNKFFKESWWWNYIYAKRFVIYV